MIIINNYRNKSGFIDLNQLDIKSNHNFKKFSFEYDNKKYFYKSISQVMELYNELIAEELATDYNIKCAHYDLAEYIEDIGVISENFLKENDKFILLYDILKEYYKENETLEHNNLIDIRCALENRYGLEITDKLIEKLKDVLVFDILLANIDRHDKNIGIIENTTVSLSPLFDNQKILDKDSIYEGIYSLRLDNENYIDEVMKEKLESNLWIINEDNINKILQRIEHKTNSRIPSFIIDETLYRFEENQKRIIKKLETKKI